MKLRDIMVLVKGKLQVRRKRTSVTVITASVLFGVVLTLLFVSSGYFGSLARDARTLLGDPQVTVSYPIGTPDDQGLVERAIELYNASECSRSNSHV